jgi:hypothetical protein
MEKVSSSTKDIEKSRRAIIEGNTRINQSKISKGKRIKRKR